MSNSTTDRRSEQSGKGGPSSMHHGLVQKFYRCCGCPTDSDFFLIYFPFFILASAGFVSSSGIAQECPIRTAPATRPSRHRIWMRRGEIPQRSAVCAIDKYVIRIPPALTNARLSQGTQTYYKYNRKSEQNQLPHTEILTFILIFST